MASVKECLLPMVEKFLLADAQKAANGRVPDIPISVQVTSDTLPLSVYRVGYVPFAAAECEDADGNTIGPCPDILIKKQSAPELVHLPNERIAPFIERDERQLLNASCVATQSIYITVNEQGKIIKIMSKVKPDTNAAEVLGIL